MTPNPLAAADARHAPVARRHDALPPGTRLDEFEIGPLLGESPVGLAYLATDLSLDRQVTIREYLPLALSGRGDGPLVALRSAGLSEPYRRGLRAFVEEGRLLARCDHPSLARVLRFWEANFTAYLVMPYFDAPTLVEARQRLDAPPAEDWVRSLIDSLAGALELLHQQSCLHRRVSPMRVLMLRDGRPLLLGPSAVRQVLGEQAQTSMIQPGYSAIEEYAESPDLPQGPWTDVYSLGALARFCILGAAPPAATVRSVRDTLVGMTDAVWPLRVERPELSYSPSLLTAIDRALAVDPKHRPQSIAHFRMLLASAPAIPAMRTVPLEAEPFEAKPLEAKPPETDPETTQLQASLSALVDEAIADAPPMRSAAASHHEDGPTHIPAAAARAANEGIDRLLGTVPGRKPVDPSPLLDLDHDDHGEPTVQENLDAMSDRREPPSPVQRPFWQRKPFGGAVAALAVATLAYFGWDHYRQFQTDRMLATADTPLVTRAPSAGPTSGRLAGSSAAAEALARADATLGRGSPPVAEPTPGASAAAVPSAPPVSATTVAAVTVDAAPASAPRLVPQTPFVALQPVTRPAATEREAPPAKAEARAPAPVRREAAAEREPPAPRAVCGGRTAFSLYYCMKQQCDKPQFTQHVQCKQLRLHDTVD